MHLRFKVILSVLSITFYNFLYLNLLRYEVIYFDSEHGMHNRKKKYIFIIFSGYFRDTIGSYDYIFYINGAIGTLVGIMWFFEPYYLKCAISTAEPIQESL